MVLGLTTDPLHPADRDSARARPRRRRGSGSSATGGGGPRVPASPSPLPRHAAGAPAARRAAVRGGATRGSL